MYLPLYERINNVFFYVYEFPSVVKVVVMTVVTSFALLDILLDFKGIGDGDSSLVVVDIIQYSSILWVIVTICKTWDLVLRFWCNCVQCCGNRSVAYITYLVLCVVVIDPLQESVCLCSRSERSLTTELWACCLVVMGLCIPCRGHINPWKQAEYPRVQNK